jgi:hypothetical protein
MLGTTQAMVLTIGYIVFAGLLGIVAGGVTSAILRQRWGLKAIGTDLALAMIVAVVAGYVLTEIDIRRGVWNSALWPLWTTAVVSVIAMHLLCRPRLRR